MPKMLKSTQRHIFTGIAQYFNLTWHIWLRHCLNGRTDDVKLEWPSLLTSIPIVERQDNVSFRLSRQAGSNKIA